MSPRNVNKHRNLIGAIFNHAVKRGVGRFKLAANPVAGIELRREAKPAPLIFFTPEEIEAVARALTAGAHRDRSAELNYSAEEIERRRCDDEQDAEAVRLAAYTAGCVAASSLRSGGAMSTGPGPSSPCPAPSAGTSRARLRAAVTGTFRSQTRRRRRWSACRAGEISSAPRISCCVTPGAGISTPPRWDVGTTEPVTRPA
jgi:hypothetical protein